MLANRKRIYPLAILFFIIGAIFSLSDLSEASRLFQKDDTTEAPVISGFSPDSGPPGTLVNITGDKFKKVTSVEFNGIGTSFNVVSEREISAIVPDKAETGPITVTSEGGTGFSPGDFRIIQENQPPEIKSISPDSGPVGTTVTISGNNFADVIDVSFSGFSASFNVNSNEQITATVPKGAESGPVTVTSKSGSDTGGNFNVIVEEVVPEINSFSPDSGPAGTTVSINGNNFIDVKEVTFNGLSAQFSVSRTSQIIATVPKGAVTGPIMVNASGGSATSSSNFTVIEENPLPVIISFSPDRGAFGSSVTINGNNFTDVGQVDFNGVNADFSINSPTQILATVPKGAVTGPITVTAKLGSATSRDIFTVTGDGDAPTITSFSPSNGPVGSEVLIIGSNFASSGSVLFNGLPADFNATDTQITTVVPAGATTGPITVITKTGRATSAADFIVDDDSGEQELTITAFSPRIGPVGTTVTITGTGFVDINMVAFNGIAANFNINSQSQILAEVPQGATTGPITIISDTGMATSAIDFIVASSVVQFDMSNYSVNEGSNQIEIAVERRGDSTSRATVVFATADGTAESGTNYLPVTGRLVFEANEIRKTFVVPILDDSQSNGDLTVVLTLDAATDAQLGDRSRATLIIKDNEPANTPILQVQQMIDFGATVINQTSTMMVEVRNGGSQTLNFSLPTIADGISAGFFIATSPNTLTLRPNESAFFMAGFKPTTLNLDGVTGAISINSNGGNRIITLAGRSIELTPPTVGFDSPQGGETLVAGQPFTIRFTGSDDDRIASYSLVYQVIGTTVTSEIARVSGDTREVIWNVPDNLRSTQGTIIIIAIDRSGNAGRDTTGLLTIAPPATTTPTLQVVLNFDPPTPGQLAPPQNVRVDATELGKSTTKAAQVKVVQLENQQEQPGTNAQLIGYNIYRVPEPPPDQPEPTAEQIVGDPKNLIGSISSNTTSFNNQVATGQSNTGNFVYSVTSFFGNGQSSNGSSPTGTELPVISNPSFKQGSIFINARSSFIQSGAKMFINDRDSFTLRFDESGTRFMVDKKTKSPESNMTIKKLIKKGQTVRLTVMNPDGKLSVGVMFTRK